MRRFLVPGLLVTCCVGFCLGRSGAPDDTRRRVGRRIIQLTAPRTSGSVSLEEALAKRRSVRQFSSQALTPDQISQLAWAGQGITERTQGLRTAPSAGSTYPITLYFVSADGVFRYRPEEHALEEVANGDVRAAMAGTADGPMTSAPLSIVVTGSAAKVAERFRQEARTYTLLEAGHVTQNILLQAVCLDLGAVPIGGLDKRLVSESCRLARGHDPLYVVAIGYAASQDTQNGQPGDGTPTITGKRALLIVPSQAYSDEELFGTMRMLEAAGVQLTLASSRAGVMRGMGGGVVESRVTLNQVRAVDFDAVIFIGGYGATEYYGNPLALGIAREAERGRKVLAATGLAPTTLASAGVLRGVRATGVLEEQARMQQMGAIFTGAAVERDGYIVTANGPAAVMGFGRAIIDALGGY